MSFAIETTRDLGNGFRLETGSRTDAGARATSAPCIWLIKISNQKEVARADRCWATGSLQFHFDGGRFNDADEFNHYIDALNTLREMAKSLPANPEPAKG